MYVPYNQVSILKTSSVRNYRRKGSEIAWSEALKRQKGCQGCCGRQHHEREDAAAVHLQEPEAPSTVNHQPGARRIAVHRLGFFFQTRPDFPSFPGLSSSS